MIVIICFIVIGIFWNGDMQLNEIMKLASLSY